MKRLVIAIDGPAGAGKSSVTARLAERLGYVRVDTGAMYRAVALAAMEAGIALDEQEALGAFAEQLVEERALQFEVREGMARSVRPPALEPAIGSADHRAAALGSQTLDGDTTLPPPSSRTRNAKGTAVQLRGRDISAEIRTPAVSLAASAVARISRVRDALLQLQRIQAAQGGVVLEGRDIGTVVFPNADLKIFLTASPEVRARRRWAELHAKGATVTYEETLADVMARDEADEQREVAPLRKADDAVLVDSSDLTEDEVVLELCRLARNKEGA